MKSFFKMGILVFIVSFVFGCDRKSQENSSVKIQVPSSSDKVGSLSACITQKCLKEIIVNVNGEGIPQTIVARNRTNFDDLSVVTGEIEVVVPSGKSREIKVIGVFRKGTKAFVQYAANLVDLYGDVVPDINMQLGNETEFFRAMVAGRYLTGPNSGPTGKVFLTMGIPNSNFSIDFGEESILNGWFKFNFSKNFMVSAKLDNGQFIFDKKNAEELVPIASSGTQVAARIHNRLNSFWKYDSSLWKEDDDLNDIVFGFFGDPTFTSGNLVCLQDVPNPTAIGTGVLAASSTGTPSLTYRHYDDAVAHIYGIGGLSGGDPSCTGVANANRYASSAININYAQLYKNGKDETLAMDGSFTSVVSGTQVLKHFQNGVQTKLSPLPGTFSNTDPLAIFDSARVFSKNNANNGLNGNGRIKCNTQWLTDNGFSEITLATAPTLVPASSSTDFLTFNYLSSTGSHLASNQEGIIVCPTKSGQFHNDGLGGIYLGNSFNAGITLTSGNSSLNNAGTPNPSFTTMTLTNYGNVTTQFSISFSAPSSLNYKGSSYPGTAGTCAGNHLLGPGASCTIQVESLSVATETIMVMVNFHNGHANTSTSFSINAN